jgi:hypothetical protein
MTYDHPNCKPSRNKSSMKKNALLLLIVLLVAITACVHFDRESSDLSLQYREDDEEYSFTGRFDKSKTGKVEGYIEKTLEENWLFGKANDWQDYEATLEDHTKIHIKASPGKLKIVLDKEENSRTSYLKVKQMCEGLKEILRDK